MRRSRYSRYDRYSPYPEYVPVAEKKAKAEKKLKELRKKQPGIRPVIIEGSALARTWWGKSWNKNLEQYADYSNRIGRGRSYVRHGAVLDLQIAEGKVRALVQGSTSRPYSVEIQIAALKNKIWQDLIAECKGMLDSVQELLSGAFPRELGEVFMRKDAGLFPSPREIKFNCSCPDWAGMCKHVAAALYGIATRLDEDPALFFRLRNKAMDKLIHRTVLESTERLIAKTTRRSSRVIEDSDISSVFGIEIEEAAIVVPSRKAPEKKGKAAVTGKKPDRKVKKKGIAVKTAARSLTEKKKKTKATVKGKKTAKNNRAADN